MSKEKKSASTKPVKDLSHDEELKHYMSIMIEDFHSKLDLVVEGMNVMRRELEAKIDSVKSDVATLRDDMNNQFSFLHSAIRCNADGIRCNAEGIRSNAEGIRSNAEGIRNNAEGIRELRADVGQLKTDMVEVKGLLNHVVNRADDHEERIGRLERVS